MKKQFFYAALAIALMSSCSKDNDPGITPEPENPTPDVIDDTTPVAIELGINAPTVATTRGTGSVGDLATDAAKNVWNSQPLSIFMYPKSSMPASYTSPISAYKFIAPASSAADNKITIASGDVPYYPMQGAFDFYGYHMDTTTSPEVTPAEGSLAVSGTIDGTNDVMAAIASVTLEDQAKLLNKYYEEDALTFKVSDDKSSVVTDAGTALTAEQQVVLAKEMEKAFSSYAARRDIQPTLIFKHLLTRLKFNVKAGETQAAIDQYTGAPHQALPPHKFPTVTEEMLTQLAVPGAIVDAAPAADGNDMTDGAVYIYSIKVTNQKNGISITFKPGTAPVFSADGTSVTTPAALPTYTPEFTGTDGAFTLMDRDAAAAAQPAEAIALTPTATAKLVDPTPVGESMMVAPEQESFKIEIIVMQYVVTNTTNNTYTWKLSQLSTTVKAPTLMPDPKDPTAAKVESTDKNDAGNFIFATGKSYNINITVYGYQKIEIDAVLTGWIAGDDVEVNPEDDAFNN